MSQQFLFVYHVLNWKLLNISSIWILRTFYCRFPATFNVFYRENQIGSSYRFNDSTLLKFELSNEEQQNRLPNQRPHRGSSCYHYMHFIDNDDLVARSPSTPYESDPSCKIRFTIQCFFVHIVDMSKRLLWTGFDFATSLWHLRSALGHLVSSTLQNISIYDRVNESLCISESCGIAFLKIASYETRFPNCTDSVHVKIHVLIWFRLYDEFIALLNILDFFFCEEEITYTYGYLNILYKLFSEFNSLRVSVFMFHDSWSILIKFYL